MTVHEVKIVGVKNHHTTTKQGKPLEITEIHSVDLKPIDSNNNYMVHKFVVYDNQSIYNVGEKVKVYTIWSTEKKKETTLMVERMQ